MLALKIEGIEPVKIIQAPTDKSLACIGMFFVNYGSTDLLFDVYIVPNGKSVPIYDTDGNLVSGNEECIFIKEKLLTSKDTFMLNLEKILLHPLDAIYVRKYDDTSKLAVHVSYEMY